MIKHMAESAFDVRICRHCDSPDCIIACPTDAMSLDERGVVIIDDDECVRCGACAIACPHNAIKHYEATDRYLKCDLCAGREGGPLCVELCPVGALTLADVSAIIVEDT